MRQKCSRNHTTITALCRQGCCRGIDSDRRAACAAVVTRTKWETQNFWVEIRISGEFLPGNEDKRGNLRNFCPLHLAEILRCRGGRAQVRRQSTCGCRRSGTARGQRSATGATWLHCCGRRGRARPVWAAPYRTPLQLAARPRRWQPRRGRGSPRGGSGPGPAGAAAGVPGAAGQVFRKPRARARPVGSGRPPRSPVWATLCVWHSCPQSGP